MASEQPKEQRRFNFPNYEYFKVSKRNLLEFKVIVDEIRLRSKNKKVIEPRIINRFFTLLERERLPIGTNSKISHDQVVERIAIVFLYITTQRKSNDYLFGEEKYKKPVMFKLGKKSFKLYPKYGNFLDMLAIVTENIREIEYYNYDEWNSDKDFCIKEIFKMFVRYYWTSMSENQRKQYSNPYKFIALSALLAKVVWNITISYTNPITMYRYHQRGIYAIKKFKIDIRRLMEEPCY